MMSHAATTITRLVAAANVNFGASTEKDVESFFRELDTKSLDEADVGQLRKLLEIISKQAPSTTALNIFYKAIERYPTNTLTPIHHYIVRQCCMLRTYDAAKPLLAQSIHHIPSGAYLTYHDHLLYHFYGALCLTAMGDNAKALSFLKMVLGAGGRNTSRIQLEAYRKYILITLIHTGKPASIPKTVGLSTQRSLELLAAPYLDFQGAYLVNDTELQQIVEKHSAQFKHDGNHALVQSAVASLAIHRILDLQKIFISISIKDIAERIRQPEEAVEQTLNSMIRTRRIHATIGSDRYVSFPNLELDEEQDLAKLQAQYQETAILTNRMRSLQRSLELEPDYIAKFMQNDNSYRDSERSFDRKGKGRSMKSPTAGNFSEDSEEVL